MLRGCPWETGSGPGTSWEEAGQTGEPARLAGAAALGSAQRSLGWQPSGGEPAWVCPCVAGSRPGRELAQRAGILVLSETEPAQGSRAAHSALPLQRSPLDFILRANVAALLGFALLFGTFSVFESCFALPLTPS